MTIRKSDDLSSIPRSHTVEGEPTLKSGPLISIYMLQNINTFLKNEHTHSNSRTGFIPTLPNPMLPPVFVTMGCNKNLHRMGESEILSQLINSQGCRWFGS